MCLGCYSEYGQEVPGEQAIATVPLIAAVYTESYVGGRLHIILDDWNLEDVHIRDVLAEPDLTDAERACASALEAMPIGQRAAAIAMYEQEIGDI